MVSPPGASAERAAQQSPAQASGVLFVNPHLISWHRPARIAQSPAHTRARGGAVRRTIALGIGLLVTLLAVACGNGGSKSATPTPAANPCGGASTAGCGDATTPDVRAATLTGATFAGVPQDGLTLGKADAPLTIDLYQNFLCPHCRDFAEAMMPQLIADYIATGRARIVFHDAALGPDEARLAHEAAHCAADQGKFWPAYAALYANFSDDPGAYTKASIEAWL